MSDPTINGLLIQAADDMRAMAAHLDVWAAVDPASRPAKPEMRREFHLEIVVPAKSLAMLVEGIEFEIGRTEQETAPGSDCSIKWVRPQ